SLTAPYRKFRDPFFDESYIAEPTSRQSHLCLVKKSGFCVGTPTLFAQTIGLRPHIDHVVRPTKIRNVLMQDLPRMSGPSTRDLIRNPPVGFNFPTRARDVVK